MAFVERFCVAIRVYRKLDCSNKTICPSLLCSLSGNLQKHGPLTEVMETMKNYDMKLNVANAFPP